MKRTERPLYDYAQSVRQIARLSQQYSGDMADFYPGDIAGAYRALANIPYTADNGEEVVQRPAYTLQDGRGDCKKKAVCFAAWCVSNGVPVRFIVCSTRRDKQPHHIYTEYKSGGKWCPADVTYSRGQLGKILEVETYREAWEI